eukprot:gene5387-biopygen5372
MTWYSQDPPPSPQPGPPAFSSARTPRLLLSQGRRGSRTGRCRLCPGRGGVGSTIHSRRRGGGGGSTPEFVVNPTDFEPAWHREGPPWEITESIRVQAFPPRGGIISFPAVHDHGRQQGGDDELVLEGGLDLLAPRHLPAGEAQKHEDRREEAGDHPRPRHEDREHDPRPRQPGPVRGDDEGGAGRLSEGAEEVAPHPCAAPPHRVCVGGGGCDVADVVADAVRDHAGVPLVVLREPRHHLPAQVRADVGRLREDPAAHAAERRHRRAEARTLLL